MKFTLLERIVLPTLVPKEGSYTELITFKSINEKFAIQAVELELYNITASDKGVSWNELGKTAEFDIELLDIEKVLIKGILTKLDTEKKLSADTIGLFEKFVEKINN